MPLFGILLHENGADLGIGAVAFDMERPVTSRAYYCAFYGPKTKGLQGQQNLSLPVRRILAANFDFVDVSLHPDEINRFPNVGSVIFCLLRVWAHRMYPSGACKKVTVLDMVHSVVALPRERSRDRLIVLGHDSYALRTRRDFASARGIRNRLRLGLSQLAWSFAELLLRRVAWRVFYVSPVDLASAKGGAGVGLVAIPVEDNLRDLGQNLRAAPRVTRDRVRKIVVSLPVENPTQTASDIELIRQLLVAVDPEVEITLWGNGAGVVAQSFELAGRAVVIKWVDDYAAFLSSFDLLVYPRMVGSGFHTKLAEALVLNVPCLCVDWIAAALVKAGYTGITTFTGPEDFSAALDRALASAGASQIGSMPNSPQKAEPEAAIAPLIEACREAMTNERLTRSDR